MPINKTVKQISCTALRITAAAYCRRRKGEPHTENYREKAETLSTRFGISKIEAMKALEECDGDILDAVSLLECKGIINRTSAAYNPNTKKEKQPFSSRGVNLRKETSGTYTPPPQQGADNISKNIGKRISDLLKKSIEYSFNVYKGEKKYISMPVLSIVILAVFAFWITLVGLAAGLIAGCRYEIAIN